MTTILDQPPGKIQALAVFDRDAARRYLAALFAGQTGIVHMAFGHGGHREAGGKYGYDDWRPASYAYPAGTNDLLADSERAMTACADVFVCPYLRPAGASRAKGTALSRRFVHADYDGDQPLPPELAARLRDLGAFTVGSGTEHHRHVYLPLTDEVDRDTHERLCRALRATLGLAADPKVADNDVLRLPGTVNCKTSPPAPVTWISKPTGRAVSPQDALAALRAPEVSRPADRAPRTSAAPSTGKLPPYVMAALANDTGDRSADTMRVIAACVREGLTLTETRAVVRSRDDLAERLDSRPDDDVATCYGKAQDRVAEERRPLAGGQSHTSNTVSKDAPLALTSGSNTSHTSNTGSEISPLLAGARSGAWLSVQEFPALEYRVQGVIPEGLTLLVGPPKAGKSWLILGILLAVSSGGIALSAIPCTSARPVFYLALEDGDRRMQSRCQTLLGSPDIPERFHYQTQVNPGALLPTVRAFMDSHPDTGLVVIDTLGKVMPPSAMGQSAYQRDYQVGSELKALADEYPGLAVVVLHHARKASSDDFVDTVSGTNGLAGAADTIIVLVRKRQSSDGTLHVTGRDVAEAEYALTVTDGTSWKLEGGTLAAAAEVAASRTDALSLGDKSRAIVEMVRQAGRIRAGDVAAVHGPGSYEYLRRLTTSGQINQVERGFYVCGPALTAGV